MSELSILHAALRTTAARRRADHALRGLWRGLLIGSALWLAAYALYKVAPIPPELAEWGWIAALVGAVVGGVLGGWRRVPLATAARVLEQRQTLQQRLSTALEVSQDPEPTEWSRLVVSDAAASLRGVQPAKLLPLGLPAFARWIPLILVLVVGLGFVPEYRSSRYLQAQREREIIRDTGRKMAELVRHEMEHRPPEQEAIRDALGATAALGDRLSQVKLTKAEAIKDLASAAKRLESEAQQLESQPVLRRLQQAARSPSGGETPGAQALQKQIEKLREQAENGAPDALDQLAKKLENARRMAAGMQGANADAAAQQALSEALENLAQSASALGLDPSSLNSALDAMKNLNIDRVLRDLKLAGDDLDKLTDMAKKLADMQKNMADLGKNLAEQLERGQAEAAAQTLDKMVADLKKSGLSPEQLQKMTGEIAEALKPAGDYGKVADLLKAAASGMNSKQGETAASNLAMAAAELRKMLQQAEDLQMAAATLQALENAQLALLNDRAWSPGTCKGGMCPGCSLCKGAGKGSRMGAGVGTWADENGWLYFAPTQTPLVDNSGLQRPDMDPRGHTDRGEGQLSPNLAPTKLTGQFTPGQMPSITLKGVSVKGQSSVQYQEAVTAAQSDAQSALNQDRVPRAYRGAVKGYFDDLK